MAKICNYCEGWGFCEKEGTSKDGYCEEHQEEYEEYLRKEAEEKRMTTFPLVAKKGHVFLFGMFSNGLPLAVTTIPYKPKTPFDEVKFEGKIPTTPQQVYKVFEENAYVYQEEFLYISSDMSNQVDDINYYPILFLPDLPPGI